jgi:Protein of unknown function (DUF1997)
MFKTFQATESVKIAIPKQTIPIQEYLIQPQPLVDALQEQSKIQILAKSKGNSLITFRFALEPLAFLQLKISPIVDLDAWSDKESNMYLRSQSSQLRVDLLGIEIPSTEFELKLKGEIHVEDDILIGNASLSVIVEVPPPVSFTPESILQITGDSLVSNVLLTMKQRLLQQLVKNYSLWVEAQINSVSLST